MLASSAFVVKLLLRQVQIGFTLTRLFWGECRWNALAPYLPEWCNRLKDWAFMVHPPEAQTSLSDSSNMGPVGASSVGLGLGWLENALDFGSWAVCASV